MTTSEQTTGEIVRDLRLKTKYGMELTNGDFPESAFVTTLAADRLESQAKENEISRHLIEMQSNVITDLTARAESAERERDAAIGHVHDAIFVTNHSCFYCTMENCEGCTNSTVKEHFKYRGLIPQKYFVKTEDDIE